MLIRLTICVLNNAKSVFATNSLGIVTDLKFGFDWECQHCFSSVCLAVHSISWAIFYSCGCSVYKSAWPYVWTGSTIPVRWQTWHFICLVKASFCTQKVGGTHRRTLSCLYLPLILLYVETCFSWSVFGFHHSTFKDFITT